MTKEIKYLMKKLDISEQEAIELIQFDKDVNSGIIKDELTKEQKAVIKKMTNAETHKKTERKATPKKIVEEKAQVFNDLINDLEKKSYEEIKILNPNREVEFLFKGKKFKIVLSMPRK